MQASLIKAAEGLSTLNYSGDKPCLPLSNSHNLSFHFCSCRPHMGRNRGQYFNDNCCFLAFLNDLLIKKYLPPSREKPPTALHRAVKWESLPLLPAFGSLQIDLIYYGPQNSGISYNFCHVSSLLLLKINSPKRKWFPRDNRKSVTVSFLLSILSGELKRENISKTIFTFFF